jgi:hypothetical protein
MSIGEGVRPTSDIPHLAPRTGGFCHSCSPMDASEHDSSLIGVQSHKFCKIHLQSSVWANKWLRLGPCIRVVFWKKQYHFPASSRSMVSRRHLLHFERPLQSVWTLRRMTLFEPVPCDHTAMCFMMILWYLGRDFSLPPFYLLHLNVKSLHVDANPPQRVLENFAPIHHNKSHTKHQQLMGRCIRQS